MREINYIREIVEKGTSYKYRDKDDKDSKYYVFGKALDEDTDLKHYLYDMGLEIDDYHFEWLNEAFEIIGENIDFNSFKSLDRLRKVLEDFEFEDKITQEVWTSNLTKWLASKNDRVEYLSNAIENGAQNGFDALQIAYMMEKSEVYYMAKNVLLHKIAIIKGEVVNDE